MEGVMVFRPAPIDGIIWKPLTAYIDGRGWLCELFRHDEMLDEFYPVMGYVSETKSGITRGPHEHVQQADCFAFLGPGNFRLHLWDNRPGKPTFGNYETQLVGQDRPMMVVIPPGVVHAYHNVSDAPGWVMNFPNQLYRGLGKRAPVDEIRHEDDPNTRFIVPGRRAA
jgi:dTDP-4-dehydrorhamnose 3,5-epimerase